MYLLLLAEECQRNTGRETCPTVVVSSPMDLGNKYDAGVDPGLPKKVKCAINDNDELTSSARRVSAPSTPLSAFHNDNEPHISVLLLPFTQIHVNGASATHKPVKGVVPSLHHPHPN